MHESEKWKWSHSVVSDSSWPHGLQPTRLLRPWDFPGKSTGVGCRCLLLIPSLPFPFELVLVFMFPPPRCELRSLSYLGFPGAPVVKNLPANAGDVRDTGLIPGSGRSPRGGHGNPLQYSCLWNPMNRGAWQATVHRVSELDATEAAKHVGTQKFICHPDPQFPHLYSRKNNATFTVSFVSLYKF